MTETRITLRPALVAWILIGLLGACVGALFVLPQFEAERNRVEATSSARDRAPEPRRPEGIDRRQLDGNEPIDPEAYRDRPPPGMPNEAPADVRSKRP